MKEGKHRFSGKEYFVELLNKHFGSSPFFNDLTFTNHIDEERKWVIENLSNIKWQNVNFDVIVSNPQSIFFLSPKAFCYYLPAFMKVGVTMPQENEVISAILTSLTLPKNSAEQKD